VMIERTGEQYEEVAALSVRSSSAGLDYFSVSELTESCNARIRLATCSDPIVQAIWRVYR
jgi:hypothetical protein